MRNKRILFLLLVLGLITACDNRPKEVLSGHKMEAIMVDLFLFEGTANVKKIAVNDTVKAHYYNQILKKHRVTIAQYDSSLVWYIKNPEDYATLNEGVTKQLKKLEKEIKAGNYIRPIAPNDSLDSLMIRVEKRELFISPTIPISTQFTIKDKGLVSGDIIKIRFQVRVNGEPKNPKASSIITVNYTDNTHDEKKIALNLDSVFNKCNLSIATDKKKKISYIKLNIFKLEKNFSTSQSIYINDIFMQRVFNPYSIAK